ncbi:HAD-IC family P-type ATPase [Apilactobacillus apisilvae]|uniref:HAD-IC family P-type ATPase n=1 Tax=Apilactobacillus apisilvae TaxID=2923364 RepID=A0ABY4PFJ7_9LACO|nr:HAD-IC family P-type ATPase [Apilactobacillus apisilvae]UQS84566.1 HAD-IC family P-type ATPase [Apilactobacillus apisilvae]
MAEQVNSQQGLTESKANELYQKGLHNSKRKDFTLSVPQILKNNTFTLFNIINIVLALMVLYTGDYKNLLFLVVAIANTVIGSIQEIRSKHQLDKMAILSESKVRVIRDGSIKELDADQIVLGDVILLSHGNQVPIDGQVMTATGLQVDESQITGETKSIAKQEGDEITSGSFILSGSARILATKVGDDTFVNRMESEVNQTDKHSDSKMLHTINKIIQILTFIIVPLGITLLTTKLLSGDDMNKAILGMVASMIGMIPEGLVLLSSVTLAVSAMKLAKKKVLVRDLSAIETLARVDTICLDKTGTITTGKLKFEDVLPMNDASEDEMKAALGGIVYASDDDNETSSAIKKAIDNPNWPLIKGIPFSSDKKWSGAQFENGNYVMGAPQFVLSNMDDAVQQKIDSYTSKGYRVLSLVKVNGEVQSPLENIVLLGLILISDEIRSDAADTLAYFRSQDTDLNIISGDDPKTVSNIGSRVGLVNSDKLLDMSKVSDDSDYRTLVKKYTIFGRVTPKQKKRLIQAYQSNGHTVAMTGDGVNDMLAMKQANCGVAMASGSESTKGIADFVLINSNFSAMVNVLGEGRRVINNISSVASLYLIKTMFSLALTVLFLFITSYSYPFQPIQLTPINTVMVGLPSFLLALSPNYQRVTNQFYRKIYDVALPAAITIVGYVLAIMVIGSYFDFNYMQRATLSILVTGVIYWLALFMVSKPFNKIKLTIIIPTIVIFAMIFVFFNRIFSLVSIFDYPINMHAIIIVATALPVFFLVTSIVKRIVKKVSQMRKKRLG